jgi:hypothetical protein
LRLSLANQIADYDNSGGDADLRAQTIRRPQLFDCFDETERGADRSLGIVLMGLRITETCKQTPGARIGDETGLRADHRDASPMKSPNRRQRLFRIEVLVQRCSAHGAAGKDGNQTTLRVRAWRREVRRFGVRAIRCTGCRTIGTDPVAEAYPGSEAIAAPLDRLDQAWLRSTFIEDAAQRRDLHGNIRALDHYSRPYSGHDLVLRNEIPVPVDQ